MILAIALAASAALVAAGIAGLVTAGEVAAAWILVRQTRAHVAVRRFFRYPGGFIQLLPDDPEPRVLRWAEVDSVTLVFDDPDGTFNGLSWCTLKGSIGTTMTIGGRYPKAVVRDVAFGAERILSRASGTVAASNRRA